MLRPKKAKTRDETCSAAELSAVQPDLKLNLMPEDRVAAATRVAKFLAIFDSLVARLSSNKLIFEKSDLASFRKVLKQELMSDSIVSKQERKNSGNKQRHSLDLGLTRFLTKSQAQNKLGQERLIRFVIHYRVYLVSSGLCDHSQCCIKEADLSAVTVVNASGKHSRLAEVLNTECIPDHSNDFILTYCQDPTIK